MDELTEEKNDEVKFLLKSRWVLESKIKTKHDKEIELPYTYINRVKIKENNKAKFIIFDLLEVFDEKNNCLIYEEWLNQAKLTQNSFPEETISDKKNTLSFKLIRYDGCGQEIYHDNFYNAKFVSEESEFDYSDTKVATKTVTFSYEYKTTTIPEKQKSSYNYTMQVEYFKDKKIGIFGNMVVYDKFDLVFFDRPSLNLKENSKTIEDQKWSPIKFIISEENYKKLMNIYCNNVVRKLKFSIEADNKSIETWKVDLLHISKVEFSEKFKQYVVTFVIKDAYYEHN